MKTITNSLLLLLTSLIICSIGCDKENSDEYPEFYLEHTFSIQASDSIYTKTDTLDLTYYAEHFENIEINEITCNFTDYEGPENLQISAVFNISALGGVGMEEICSFPLQPIDSLINHELALMIQQAGIERLIDLINTPNQAVGQLSITVQNPGEFVFVVLGIIKFKQQKDPNG